MKSLDAMSNAKEEHEEKKEKGKKNSKAQKDKKKGQATKTKNVMEIEDEMIHGSEYVNDQTYEVEAVNSARKNYGKWEYGVKWVGYDEIDWVPYGNLVGEACRESSCFLFALSSFQF